MVLNYVLVGCPCVLFGGSEILNSLLFSWGIRNSESSPVLFWGSENLNPVLCSWGIRNSESSPVLFWGSEILNLLCCLGDQNSWILSCVLGGSEILNLPCFLGDQKFWLLSFAVCVWGSRNSDSSPLLFGGPNKVEIKNGKLLGRILRFLANRETFPVSFNTSLRLRVNCKNRLWN